MGTVDHSRQCIACRTRKSPELLTRLVVVKGVLMIDFDRVQPGRGAHVCLSEACVLKLKKKGLLGHSFRFGLQKRSRGKGGQRKGLVDVSLLPSGEKSRDSIIQGIDAVIEKLLVRINDKDSDI